MFISILLLIVEEESHVVFVWVCDLDQYLPDMWVVVPEVIEGSQPVRAHRISSIGPQCSAVTSTPKRY